jgi:menaquinone-dependent protoporphyrinogen oxidase
MDALIVHASRYGATVQGAEWIAERLRIEGVATGVHDVAAAPSPESSPLVILGSGLYGHRFLPSLDDYIDRHIGTLRRRRVGLFALAMRTTPVFVGGHAHGGLAHLQYLFDRLGRSVIHADMLGGQLVFSRLSEADQAEMARFYGMLRLTPAEIESRNHPKTHMDKAAYWAFAEALLKKTKELS